MSLSKKKSRLITIGEEKFSWTISPNDGFVVFVAEKEEKKGRKIEVYINSDINNFWVEFPAVKEMNLKIIKPKDTEFILKEALNLGWNPEEKGSPIVFDMIEDNLIKRID